MTKQAVRSNFIETKKLAPLVFTCTIADDDGIVSVPMLGPPRKGVWRTNQEVYTALNVTGTRPGAVGRGWRCVESGKPGRWVPLDGT